MSEPTGHHFAGPSGGNERLDNNRTNAAAPSTAASTAAPTESQWEFYQPAMRGTHRDEPYVTSAVDTPTVDFAAVLLATLASVFSSLISPTYEICHVLLLLLLFLLFIVHTTASASLLHLLMLLFFSAFSLLDHRWPSYSSRLLSLLSNSSLDLSSDLSTRLQLHGRDCWVVQHQHVVSSLRVHTFVSSNYSSGLGHRRGLLVAEIACSGSLTLGLFSLR